MSDHYLNEVEQVELIKSWWKRYGLSVVLGVVMAVAIVVGWRYYKNYETHRHEEAAQLYVSMMRLTFMLEKQAKADAHKLMTEYKSSPYAALAALWTAKNAVDKKDLEGATAALQWVLHHRRGGPWYDLAVVRLSRIYVAEKKPEQALETLEKISDDSFFYALKLQGEGDAYAALNKNAKAVAAYRAALKKLPADSPDYLTIQSKLADLPAESVSAGTHR